MAITKRRGRLAWSGRTPRSHCLPAKHRGQRAEILLVGSRIAAAIIGAATAPKPAGVPRLRNVIRVPPATGAHV